MRCSYFGHIILDSSSSFGQYSKYSFDTFFGCALYLCVVYGFHHPWVGSEEGWIESSSGSGNDLPRRTIHRCFANLGFNYSEFHISHGFVTKRAFSGAPSKALNNTLPDSVQGILVGSADKWVINQSIGAIVLWTKGPDMVWCQFIPVVLAFKKGG